MNDQQCNCVVKNREDGETQREWFKRWMCMHHWMETDYYQAKFNYNRFLVDAPEAQQEGLRLHLDDTNVGDKK